MSYNIKAWIMCPPEHIHKCTKHCKAKSKFTLDWKLFLLSMFYDYIEVTEEGGNKCDQ